MEKGIPVSHKDTEWGHVGGSPQHTSRKPRVSKKRRMKEMMRARVSKMPRTWPFIIRSRYLCLYRVSCSQRPGHALSERLLARPTLYGRD